MGKRDALSSLLQSHGLDLHALSQKISHLRLAQKWLEIWESDNSPHFVGIKPHLILRPVVSSRLLSLSNFLSFTWFHFLAEIVIEEKGHCVAFSDFP